MNKTTYNLTPIENMLDESIPSYETWKERFNNFFNNETVDKLNQDNFYNIVINDLYRVKSLLQCGYIVDNYSGLFTLDSPEVPWHHSFNLANFVRRNHQHFFKKNIYTICHDYGILNLQIKLCGLNLVHSTIPEELTLGAVLTMIGNDQSFYNIYPFVAYDPKKIDTIIAFNVFNTNDQAHDIWNFLLDCHLEGKEVFFSTETFGQLKHYVNYDRIQQVENPADVYDKEDYANIQMGYQNKIYRIV